MAKSTPLINSFNSGELSPLIDARSDINKYYSGCEKLENFIPMVEGGAKRVPGTYFLIETKYSSKKSRLIPFVFNALQSYQLEFGEYYIRVYKDKGQVVIDDSMNDFDPAEAYYPAQMVKIGCYITLDMGSGRYLFVSAPYDQTGGDTVKVEVTTSATDYLLVTAAGDTITIALAKTTALKNAANAIQHYVRLLVSVNGVDVSGWCVTENAAYAASRPVTAALAATLLTANTSIHRCLLTIADPATGIVEQDITGITQAVEAVLSCLLHGYANGQLVHVRDVVGMTEVNDRDFIVKNKAANAFYLEAENSTGYAAYSSGGKLRLSDPTTNYFPLEPATSYWETVTIGDPVEVATPYSEDEIWDVKVAQNADTMYIFHPSYAPRKLVRHSHVLWEISAPVFLGTEMYKTGYGATAKAITYITKANPGVVTCKNHGFVDGDQVYISHVLGMISVNGEIFTVAGATTHTFQLSGVNTTTYDAFYVDGSGEKNGTAIRVFQMFNAVGDYPSCGCFHKQRLAVGGTVNDPAQINLSMISEYERFIADSLATDAAIEYTLADRANAVRWLASKDGLVAGTIGGVVMIGSETTADPFSQLNVDTKRTTPLGAADVSPKIGTDALMWLTRSATGLRLLMYSLQEDRWVSPDMMRVASHIAIGASSALSGFVDMDYQFEPYPVLWCVRADGQICGLTLNIQEQVNAWFRVVTDGLFESVSVISVDGGEDEVWVIVNRTINGATKRYIEYFMPHEFYSVLADAFYVHCGLTWDGGNTVAMTWATNSATCVVIAPGHALPNGSKVRITGVTGMTEINCDLDEAYTVANTDLVGGTFELYLTDSSAWGAYTGGGVITVVKRDVTGLTHLEGEVVDALMDGATTSSRTVSSGAITLPQYANKIHIGLPFTSTLIPMKLHSGSQLGTARGKKQKVSRITMSFYNTAGGKYGPDEDHLLSVAWGTGTTPILYTEDKEAEFPGNWDKFASLCIVQDLPLPMTVLALIPRMALEE